MIVSLTQDTIKHECQVSSIASLRGAQLLSSNGRTNWWITDHDSATDHYARANICRDLNRIGLGYLVCDNKLIDAQK